MKKIMLILLILGLVLLGVGGFYVFNSQNNDSKQEMQNVATQKQGTTTKTGTISQAGGRFYLADNLGESMEIESYDINLSQYVGQKVTVSGQYSGDTLFVGAVE